MEKIQIFTDSLCDCTPELIKQGGFHVVPLFVHFKGDEKEYLDGVDISPEEIYEIVDKTSVLPSTAAVTPDRFINEFKKATEAGNKVIYIGTGSGISSTYQSAVIAAGEFKEGMVTVIDSQTLSSGISLLLFKTKRLVEEGKNPEEIKSIIEKDVKKLSVKFCVEKMDYLYHGGRCSGLAKIFGTALHIHPVITVKDNKLSVTSKPRGLYKKALDEQIKLFIHDLKRIDLSCVFITHSGGQGFDGDQYIYHALNSYVPEGNLHITRAGAVVSSHCGPGTIGILYLLK